MTDTSVRERAKEELRLYAGISLYLYVCFGALVLYQDALMQIEGGQLLRHGVAAVKALLLLVVVAVLSIVEELVMGAVHGQGLKETLAGLEHTQWLMLVAKGILAMLILLPMVTLEALERVLGRGAFRRLLFAATNPT